MNVKHDKRIYKIDIKRVNEIMQNKIKRVKLQFRKYM